MNSENTCAALIRYAARTAPAALSERLEEEWLADLAAHRGALSQLRFAMGCCWATRVIAHEHLVSALAVARSSAGNAAIVSLGHSDWSFPSRRTAVLLLIIVVHAILIYGFASAFMRRVINVTPIMDGVMVRSPHTQAPPPPSIDPNWEAPRPILPRQSSDFNIQPESTDVPQTTFSERPVSDASSPSAAHLATRVVGGPGQGFPSAEDYYPSSARRLSEQGLAIVQVCVDERGRLSADPTIARSSGSSNLDLGALKLARAGSGHYRTTTVDSRPVSDCYPVRIRFQLTD